jgi:hypothetical protein
MTGGTLTPAYGHDYTSKKLALADWNANMDFVFNSPTSGGYINRRQANENGMKSLQIRWKRNTMVAIINRKANSEEWS